MGRNRDFHSAARTDPGYLGERLAIARHHHHNLLTTHITEPRAEMARQAELAFTSNRTVALLLGSLGAMEALVSAEFARAEAKPKGPRLCDVFAKQMRRVEPDAAVNVLGPAIEALMIDGFGTGALLYEPSATEIPAHRPTSWSASLKGDDDASSRSRILFQYVTA